MERKCGRCGQKMENEQFLCPKCGAIYGQPEYNQPKTHPAKQDPKPQKRIHPMMVVMLTLLVEAALCIMLWKPITGLFVPQPNTHPSTTSTAPTTGIEPEVYYVKVVDQIGNPVPDVTISYRVVNLSAVQQAVTDENGTVVIPRTGGYEYFQVAEIPAGYTLSGIEKLMSVGSDRIEYTVYLQAQKARDDLAFSLTILDENMEPVSGVGLRVTHFATSYIPDITYTDDHGRYEVTVNKNASFYITVESVPLGYSQDMIGKNIYFKVEDQLDRYWILESETIPENSEKYMVRLWNQYGVPLGGVLTTITDGRNTVLAKGYTNHDGYFWAYLPVDDSYCVTVNQTTIDNMQYSTILSFFRGTTEMYVTMHGEYIYEG